MGIGAAVAAGGAALSAGASLVGGSQAAGASKQAAANNFRQFLTTRADLNPYNLAGQNVLPQLTNLATSGTTGGSDIDFLRNANALQPGQMTQAQLEATPGYQFNLAQGLKSTQSAAAARGLGVSGAALKGAATYATGLADSTYQNQFNNAQTRFQNALNLNTAWQGNMTNQFNKLSSVAALGEGAASQTGQIGANLSNASGQFLQQGGLSQAAGTAGVGNAVTGGINNFLANQFLQQAVGGGGTGGFPQPHVTESTGGGVFSVP